MISDIFKYNNSRNIFKNLKSKEEIIRTKSLSKWSPKKFLVIQDGLSEIDRYLLGDSKAKGKTSFLLLDYIRIAFIKKYLYNFLTFRTY